MLKLITILIITAVAVFAYLSRPGSVEDRGVRFFTREIHSIKVVELDPRRIDIEPVLPRDKQNGEQFSTMVERLKPRAAINGTFYAPDMHVLGDVVASGKILNRGRYRNAFAVRNDGKVMFLRRPKKGSFDWKGYRSAIAGGPRLVHNGRIDLDPVADGFSHASLSIVAWRCGVGQTHGGKILFVTATKSLTFAEFAKTMLDLDCVEAMNIDGGGACALYYDGNFAVAPTLQMANIIAAFDKKSTR